jgi:hypothetical protein
LSNFFTQLALAYLYFQVQTCGMYYFYAFLFHSTQPQDAYRKALDRMRVEAADLGLPVEECFPEWPKLRQQYCRIRKQAVRQRQQEKWEWMMMARGAGLPPGQVCLP